MAQRYEGTGHAAARTTVPREVVVQAKCRPLFNRANASAMGIAINAMALIAVVV
jgi:hypothetical protein